MHFDTASVMALLAILIALLGNLVMLTRGFTRLEEGLKVVRRDLDTHTAHEEQHFKDFRQRLHSMGNHAQRLEVRQSVVESKLGIDPA